MINHGYTVKRTGEDVVDRNLDAIEAALGALASAINVPILYTFVSDGLNGTGLVALVPPKLPNGATPLYRALAGMQVVTAVDLTNLTNLQTSFEQVLSNSDSVRQLNSTNLAASSILFILQG